ncbi:hypothetical protein AYM40_09735 [Paraburkholderia phytofirmans OLGA172]|uniref:Uncharacterized protein n=1 Tax=Paraburkholderia phytofirmans OLGA172 TaxID=1417228 RepID=A0A167VY59_9BURK|nr:hypothetical protein [Paraburkholderia phytofirmans]ANB72617.1 hypothetical protein AYM40_09735 [Paraburkholderia phytofirmans OLGA172]
MTEPEHEPDTARTVKTAFELPLRTLFLIDLVLDPATIVNEAASVRVILSTGSGVVKMLTATGATAAQVHVLHSHERIIDEPSVSRVADLHVSDDGKLVYSLESGEQFLVDRDSEPVLLLPLLPATGEARGVVDTAADA